MEADEQDREQGGMVRGRDGPGEGCGGGTKNGKRKKKGLQFCFILGCGKSIRVQGSGFRVQGGESS